MTMREWRETLAWLWRCYGPGTPVEYLRASGTVTHYHMTGHHPGTYNDQEATGA